MLTKEDFEMYYKQQLNSLKASEMAVIVNTAILAEMKKQIDKAPKGKRLKIGK